MKNILVVDDNKDITDMVKEMLELLGHTCSTVNSGQDCLGMLHSNSFDLVLLDVAMPVVTGIDVIKKIREDNTLNHNKVVFFTASSITDSEMEDLKRYGALDCLRKPINIGKLHDLIEKYLN